jgi:hypothetical protein
VTELVDLADVHALLELYKQVIAQGEVPIRQLLIGAVSLADYVPDLVAEIERLRGREDDIYRDGYRTGHDHGLKAGRVQAAGNPSRPGVTP